ncbi:hypothetical protein [Rossellomorea sp. LjRoot5]|uniref:hypothetical protein n=1 Tax=Rossellomorea sp. LjRoot5 TaxID=3342331 RepID=UPI003ECFEA05
MTHLWDAEVAITPCQAKKMIESQFQDLIPAEIEIMDYGFDNTVMKVNGVWVFRFPRREIAILSGVLDWGDVHLGHRAIDLNLVYSFLTPEGREFFFREYGEVEEVELEYARFKAIYTNVVLLLYGYHEKQPHTIVEAQKSLKLALT